jgi:hypothetical protein
MPNVISKIKQNSSDMNEIILAPCDAGYVQSCTGLNGWARRPTSFEIHVKWVTYSWILSHLFLYGVAIIQQTWGVVSEKEKKFSRLKIVQTLRLEGG